MAAVVQQGVGVAGCYLKGCVGKGSLDVHHTFL